MKRRHAFVIGASSGIGAATAKTLAQGGWQVTAAARRTDKLSELEALYPTLSACELDSSDRLAVQAAINQAPAIDVMIYAAGTNIPEREIEVLSHSDWRSAFGVNVDGAFHSTQAVLPKMKNSGGGLIVYVSSISAERADASGVAYQASKRALHGLAEGTALEQGSNGIRTTLIMPGLTRTDFNALRRSPPSEEERAKFLMPEDVAAAIAFVCGLPPHMMIPSLTVVPTANPWNR